MIEDKVMELVQRVQQLRKEPANILPATDEEINAFEHAHELTLPAEVKAWFQRCNGVGLIPPSKMYSLFSKGVKACSIERYFKEYPEWKKRGWIPVADDGCGDIYILATAIVIPSTGTHPVFFLDQADLNKPAYAVASGLWRFLFFLLEDEISTQHGEVAYWPFNKEKVIASDPKLLSAEKFHCHGKLNNAAERATSTGWMEHTAIDPVSTGNEWLRREKYRLTNLETESKGFPARGNPGRSVAAGQK